MGGQLRVLVLGPTVVLRGGREQELRGPAQRRILTVLAAARGEPVSDDRLAALLWGGAPPASAAATLQSHVSRLRAALGDDGRSLLRRAGEGYALHLPAGGPAAGAAGPPGGPGLRAAPAGGRPRRRRGRPAGRRRRPPRAADGDRPAHRCARALAWPPVRRCRGRRPGRHRAGACPPHRTARGRRRAVAG